MLGKLFGSNARVKILKLFLINPEKKFYIRELARDLGLQLNSVRRELENLEKFGLLMTVEDNTEDQEKDIIQTEDVKPKVNTKAKDKEKQKIKDKAAGHEKKYFQVNPDFVLFGELKGLILKAQVLYEEDFIKKVQKAGKPKLMILSGFFVNDPESTVDLFLVGRFNRPKLLEMIKELEDELGREINYTIMEVREFKYRRDITDVFLYDILERKKIMVVNELDVV